MINSIILWTLTSLSGLTITNDNELLNSKNKTIMTTNTEFTLPTLPYAYDALEPYIDAKTMEIHYERHHGAYTANLNAAIKGTDLEGKTIEEILSEVSKHSPAVRNNGGGYYNHNLFWSILTPNGSAEPNSSLEVTKAIIETFGSFDEFKTQFSQAAATRFGSGWAWLSVDKNGILFISSSPNQDNPLMDVESKNGIPVLGLDVWEHAYYLKYQNKRVDYISAFFNIVNWDEVNSRYLSAK